LRANNTIASPRPLRLISTADQENRGGRKGGWTASRQHFATTQT